MLGVCKGLFLRLGKLIDVVRLALRKTEPGQEHHILLTTADPTANRMRGVNLPGYFYLHNAADDHSQLAYTEILTDERKRPPRGSGPAANTYFTSCGIPSAEC